MLEPRGRARGDVDVRLQLYRVAVGHVPVGPVLLKCIAHPGTGHVPQSRGHRQFRNVFHVVAEIP